MPSLVLGYHTRVWDQWVFFFPGVITGGICILLILERELSSSPGIIPYKRCVKTWNCTASRPHLRISVYRVQPASLQVRLN